MPISIHGKDYVLVNERIAEFHKIYPKGSITTEVTFEGSNVVRCKALVIPEEGRAFTGHAEERRDDGNINRTSAVENCETSAVGRALAMLGIKVDTSIASADEMMKVVQSNITTNQPPESNEVEYVPEKPQGTEKVCPDCKKPFNSKYARCYPCNMKRRNANLVEESLKKSGLTQPTPTSEIPF